MSEQLELKILAGQSSSAGGSPAKISRQLEAVPGWLGSAPAFGGNMLGSFAQFCPDSLSLRTLQRSIEGDLTPFLGTLPGAGTMRNGILSARQPSGRAIDATGCSLLLGFGMLPTPTASSYGSNRGGAAGRTGKIRHSLGSMARLGMLGTPGKLSARFVQWMMGFPEGWLCSEP